MTKSTITRERLEEIRDCCWMDDLGLSMYELSELARMALAAMDSEPVAYMYDGEDGTEYNGHNEFSGGGKGIPLYRHAQPAPELKPVGYLFVSDQGAIAYSPTDWGMPGFKMAGQIFGDIDVKAQPAPVVPEDVRQALSKMDDEIIAELDAEESACRAAMLQGAENAESRCGIQTAPALDSFKKNAESRCGNSPVIPDGYRLQPISEYEAMCATVNSDEWPQRWIPVSERMPEDRTQVILWDAEIGEVTSGHYSHKTHTFYHCGDAIQNEITHWMPLPAPPQEVK